jgi:hypothetical protein
VQDNFSQYAAITEFYKYRMNPDWLPRDRTMARTPRRSPAAQRPGWTTYGGGWTDSSGTETYAGTAGGAGDEAVAGLSNWGNYTLTGAVRLTPPPERARMAGC